MYLGLIAQIDATAIWSICGLAERPPIHLWVRDPQRVIATHKEGSRSTQHWRRLDHPGPREMPSPAFIE